MPIEQITPLAPAKASPGLHPQLMLKPGQYRAALVGIDGLRYDDDDDGALYEQSWVFAVDLGDGETVRVAEFDRGSGDGDEGGGDKVRTWSEALLGRPMADQPNAAERGELLGRPCLVDVRLRRVGPGHGGQRCPERFERPDVDYWTDPRDSYARWFSYIADVMPLSIPF